LARATAAMVCMAEHKILLTSAIIAVVQDLWENPDEYHIYYVILTVVRMAIVCFGSSGYNRYLIIIIINYYY
jgi:hypothetical protein